MRALAFAASYRRGSLNRKLIEVAAALLREKHRVTVEIPEFREFYMPPYDGDLEESTGLPYGAERLARRLEAANAVIIAAPEYNHSVSGVLKNAIDWTSRRKVNPWNGKPVFLLSASPSVHGGRRGLAHLTEALKACHARVFPQSFGLPRADHAFDSVGRLKDAKELKRLASSIGAFVDWASPLVEASGSPLAKPPRSIYG